MAIKTQSLYNLSTVFSFYLLVTACRINAELNGAKQVLMSKNKNNKNGGKTRARG